MIEILPVRGIGEVAPGADLAEVIARAAPWLRDGDVLVVTSKIVSKAEGRLVPVPEQGADRERARQQAIAAETARAVAARGPTRIVATHHGFVMASAGVDASNVDPSQLALLPKDPDASARALRAALVRHGRRVAVIISDTAGRPWRHGLTDIALGAAGLAPLHDHRGQRDPYGNELQLTEMAVVDELAAAAELVKGKADRVPVAVVRGLPVMLDEDGPGVVATLVRDAASDMFSLGTAEARAAGLRDAATLPDAPAGGQADPEALERAVTSVGPHLAPSTRMVVEQKGRSAAVRCTADPSDPTALVRLGADVHRLRAALAAEDLASTVTYPAAGEALVRVGGLA
jgi:coenzyme F420-0:L-glutamate ligase / coenzyme F420-1:gamma-L-glutamate ligase